MKDNLVTAVRFKQVHVIEMDLLSVVRGHMQCLSYLVEFYIFKYLLLRFPTRLP